MAAWDWLTGDSSAQRAARREQREIEAAEAKLRAEEHVAWLRSLSPAERRAYDLEQELSGVKNQLKKLEKKTDRLESELFSERLRRLEAERRVS